MTSDPTTPQIDGVTSGNASGEIARQGWFVGHFMGEGHPLRTDGVEVKWSVYEGGERRAGWGANREATTLCVLVRGRFRLSFPGGDVWLEREGDFVQWLPNVPHEWQADGPTIVLSVRWPSVPGDSYPVPPPSGREEPEPR
jgi:quercetin dioxygenase-like cupin family protein